MVHDFSPSGKKNVTKLSVIVEPHWGQRWGGIPHWAFNHAVTTCSVVRSVLEVFLRIHHLCASISSTERALSAFSICCRSARWSLSCSRSCHLAEIACRVAVILLGILWPLPSNIVRMYSSSHFVVAHMMHLCRVRKRTKSLKRNLINIAQFL